MIERFFPNETTREKLLEGPMGPYLPRLGVKLLELGYNEGQIRRLLRTASGLGNFLHQAGISLADAGDGELEAYSANRGRTRTGRRTEDGTGLSTIQLR